MSSSDSVFDPLKSPKRLQDLRSPEKKYKDALKKHFKIWHPDNNAHAEDKSKLGTNVNRLLSLLLVSFEDKIVDDPMEEWPVTWDDEDPQFYTGLIVFFPETEEMRPAYIPLPASPAEFFSILDNFSISQGKLHGELPLDCPQWPADDSDNPPEFDDPPEINMPQRTLAELERRQIAQEELEVELVEINEQLQLSTTFEQLWGVVIRQGLLDESDTVAIRKEIGEKALTILHARADAVPTQPDTARALAALFKFQKKVDMIADNFGEYEAWGENEEQRAAELTHELALRLGCGSQIPNILNQINRAKSKEDLVHILSHISDESELSAQEAATLRKASRRKKKSLDI